MTAFAPIKSLPLNANIAEARALITGHTSQLRRYDDALFRRVRAGDLFWLREPHYFFARHDALAPTTIAMTYSDGPGIHFAADGSPAATLWQAEIGPDIAAHIITRFAQDRVGARTESAGLERRGCPGAWPVPIAICKSLGPQSKATAHLRQSRPGQLGRQSNRHRDRCRASDHQYRSAAVKGGCVMARALPTTDQPYLPSNGSEGSWFTRRWCDRCCADRDYIRNGAGGCEILAISYCDLQPPEWIIREGEPECMAFDPIDPLDMPLLSRAVVAELPFKPCLAPVGRPYCATQRKPAPELSSGAGSCHQSLEKTS